MGGWAKHAWILCPSLPAKKSAFAFLQKIFGLNLHSASKIFGTAHPLYAALRAARENSAFSDPYQLLAPLYDLARTYFTLNP